MTGSDEDAAERGAGGGSARICEVGADGEGQRLDNYLSRQLGRLPKAAVYRIIRRGEVRVNSGRKPPSYRLRAEDRVRIPPAFASRVDGAPTAAVRAGAGLLEGLEARILYEDDQYIVLDKPSGLAVHGGSGVQLGVVELLRQLRPGPFLELVHRIDRDTSGCLALARSRAALLAAQQEFREQRVRKRYVLLVEGAWPRKLKRVDLPLKRELTRSGERRVRVNRVEGKPSRTDFDCQRSGTAVSWLTAAPRTGRTHQIRVHAAQQGHPILGDSKYGTTEQRSRWQADAIPRLCLHAERLRFTTNTATIDVLAPVPDVFERLWTRLASSDT
ncbi:MAG: RluA family pseudouridine synthase [Pseudomonadota bacterium]